MRSRVDVLLDLLHTTADAALATHSLAMPGFPFASNLPFVADAQHCPTFLISRLAEHTHNLLDDDRASLMLHRAGDGGEVVRATLVGHVKPIDADELLVARYLRYQPDAERFLQLGDFGFFQLVPLRVRIIGGFAQAAWLESARFFATPTLSPAEEEDWIERFRDQLPEPFELLGVDAFGIDIRIDSGRERLLFKPGPVVREAVGPALARTLARLPETGVGGIADA